MAKKSGWNTRDKVRIELKLYFVETVKVFIDIRFIYKARQIEMFGWATRATQTPKNNNNNNKTI